MSLFKMVDGIRLEMTAEEESEITALWAANETATTLDNATNGYKYARAKAYLDIGDQLDMLWHSMDSGEIPKSAAFYNSRQSVKIQFPKPTL